MYIGIDLGGTKIAGAITGNDGDNIVNKIVIPTEMEKGKEAVTGNVIKCIDSLVATSSDNKIEAIGIGIPGRIKDNTILNAPNLSCWNGVNPADLLGKHFNTSVYTDNDANTAALAELLFGAGVGLSDFLFITISTGIGGGIISGGKLIRGYNQTAGEIGHMIIAPGETVCGCGQRGCLEAMASGTHLTNRLRQRLAENPETIMLEMVDNNPELATTHHLSSALKQGDSLALELVQKNASYIALGLLNYIQMLDPQRIIIGGGLTNLGPLFFEAIEKELKTLYVNAGGMLPEIVKSPLEQDSGVLGAVALAVKGKDFS